MKQPAITKHPRGTASFSIRVCLPDGATWEAYTEHPRPIAEIITSLETEYLGYLRSLVSETLCRCGDHTEHPDGVCDVCRMSPDAKQAARIDAGKGEAGQ